MASNMAHQRRMATVCCKGRQHMLSSAGVAWHQRNSEKAAHQRAKAATRKQLAARSAAFVAWQSSISLAWRRMAAAAWRRFSQAAAAGGENGGVYCRTCSVASKAWRGENENIEKKRRRKRR